MNYRRAVLRPSGLSREGISRWKEKQQAPRGENAL